MVKVERRLIFKIKTWLIFKIKTSIGNHYFDAVVAFLSKKKLAFPSDFNGSQFFMI